jgi:Kdo2-lipid IVA lauroyltransferase/acyltransferase
MKQLLGLLCKSLSFLIACLPKGARDFIGDIIGFLWFDVFRIRRNVAIQNVGVAFPEMSESDRVKMARWSLRHMGRTIVEYSLFPFFSRKKADQLFRYEGLEQVDEVLKLGKGAIFVTLHLGNGDLAISALSKRGYPISLISKEFKSRWLNDLWFGMRRKHGTQFISAEKSSFDILRTLKRNGIVVFVLDQFMGPPIGVRTLFFGKETGTALGCALMAGRTGTPVFSTYTYRADDGKHVAVIEELIPFLDNGPREKNIAIMTQVYTDKIESIVRRHPEQWMWIHRRWKEFRD